MIERAIWRGEMRGAIPVDRQEPCREVRLPGSAQPFKPLAQGDGDGSGLALARRFDQFSH